MIAHRLRSFFRAPSDVQYTVYNVYPVKIQDSSKAKLHTCVEREKLYRYFLGILFSTSTYSLESRVFTSAKAIFLRSGNKKSVVSGGKVSLTSFAAAKRSTALGIIICTSSARFNG